ncbi:MAG: pyridoxine/pyridoxamine 5-phosphate oxidase [Actinomycetota bacterium]|jgi:pyridoxamine 5'-phosphate oxidase
MDSFSRHEDYGQASLRETDMVGDPLAQLAAWLVDAEKAEIYEPNAFVLGTIDSSGRPTARTVLLKGLDSGLLFATNYLSRKGDAIGGGSAVTAVFGWYSMYRQVIIEGRAERVSVTESDDYFESRPRGSQLAAWASEQSRPIASRDALDQQYEKTDQRFANDDVVPRPEHWGGYRIVPTRMEFWKGRSNRMHDRIAFDRDGDDWNVTRLQP